MKHNADYRNMRAILLARCSTNGQAEDSIPQQYDLLTKFATEHEMVVVDKVASEGISGSKPGVRSDLADLLDRAKKGEFSALVFQSYDRFTRRGAEAGTEIISQFKSHGVRCISITDDIAPDSDFAWLMRGMRLHEGKTYAKNLSFAVSRGQMAHMLAGRIPYSHNIPYGFDRLYSDAEGTHLYIIRNLPDGRQAKLHPQTLEHQMFFPKNEKNQVNHYRKQPSERVSLVVGTEEAVNTVRQMFRRKFVDGWGMSKIARELNNSGVRSPKGRLWNAPVCGGILGNPIYLGKGLSNRVYAGILYMRDKDGPIRLAERTLPLKKKKLRKGEEPEQRVTMPAIQRPESEWIWFDYAHLKDFLGFDTERVEKVWAWQRKRLIDRSLGIHSVPIKDKHADSPFFLKGWLRSKQGDFAMTGRSSARGDKTPNRYYYITRAHHTPIDGSNLIGGIEANSIENAVLDVIEEVCRSPEVFAADISKIVDDKLAESQTNRASLQTWLAEKKEMEGRLIAFFDFNGETQKLLTKKREDLETRLSAVNLHIKAAEGTEEVYDVEAVATAVRDQLAAIGETIRGMPTDSVRGIVEVLVPRLVADVQTKEIEMDIALPLWALNTKNDILTVCLDGGSHLRSLHEANSRHPLFLASYKCINTPIRIKAHPDYYLYTTKTCLKCERIRPESYTMPETSQTAKVAA